MKDKKNLGDRVHQSLFFSRAMRRAEKIAGNPDMLNDLISKADQKAFEKGRGVLGEAWTALGACFRMLRAYARGRYRKIPWKTLVAMVGTVVYFLMPFDFIPDILLGFGFADDAALILWVIKAFQNDMDRFLRWEAENPEIRNPDLNKDQGVSASPAFQVDTDL